MKRLDSLLEMGDTVRIAAGSGVTFSCENGFQFAGELEAAAPELEGGFEIGSAQQQRNVIHMRRTEYALSAITAEGLVRDGEGYVYRVTRIENDPASSKVLLHVNVEGQG